MLLISTFEIKQYFMTNYTSTVEERFVKYVQIDTTADPNSTSFPSSEIQKNLGRELVKELTAMGIKDAEMDEWGYVFATIPNNTGNESLPTICFCSHMDTAPDCSGTNVKPIVHRKYDGNPITLPDDTTQIITTERHLYLKEKIGDDLITASGLTLLGADDKAGMTIMLFMIHAGVPGIYGFFLAEERGLYGSEFAAQDKHCMEIMRDVKAVISFDRKGTSSIITHQRKTRTCSDRYALELQSAFKNAGIMLNLDPEGFATDSLSFHKKNPSLECTNISVGFWDQHTCCEYQDIAYLEQLSKATISMKWPIP